MGCKRCCVIITSSFHLHFIKTKMLSRQCEFRPMLNFTWYTQHTVNSLVAYFVVTACDESIPLHHENTSTRNEWIHYKLLLSYWTLIHVLVLKLKSVCVISPEYSKHTPIPITLPQQLYNLVGNDAYGLDVQSPVQWENAT